MLFTNTRSVVASNRLSAICSKLGTAVGLLCLGGLIMLATGCESSPQQQQSTSDSSVVGSEEWVAEQFN